MPSRALFTIFIALLLAVPASAGAANRLRVGEADGVRVTHRGGETAIVFTKRATRLWSAIAGRRVEIECTQLTASGSVGVLDESSTGSGMDVPKRRQPLTIGNPSGSDYCAVSLRYETRRMLWFDTVVTIPLTQLGAVTLDEREKSGALIGTLGIASAITNGERPAGFPTPSQLTRGMMARVLRREGMRVVGLADAAGTPPAGSIGYWSDGSERAAAVTLSAAGRRLYVELGPDEYLRTNISRSIFSFDG